jgi:hypothetical protein
MTKEDKVIITGLLGLGALAALGVVFPVTSTPLSRHLIPQTIRHDELISGTITSLEADSFTLSIGSTTEERQRNEKASMTFVIDKNTTTNGTLHVEANAEVTYRQSNGHNVAVSINVLE